MQNAFKKVAKLFFIIISKIFITQNMNCNETLCTSQQQIAVDDEKLHYIRRKIVTQNEKYSNTRALAPLFI